MFHFIPPQSHTVTQIIFLTATKCSYFLFCCKRIKLKHWQRSLLAALHPFFCLDSKKQKQQIGQNWQSQRKVVKQCEEQNICAKKSKSFLLSVASLYIQLMTPSPHSSVEQAQQIAGNKVSCKHSVLCMFDSSFITPEWSERHTPGNCFFKLTIRHASLPGRATSINKQLQLTVNLFKAVV